MASFPEDVLRVRFRWQQFNKYMVPTRRGYSRLATEQSADERGHRGESSHRTAAVYASR